MTTRDQILYKNFEAIQKHGFQGLRTDKVIADLGITKGAFYHYFKDKSSIGYAIVDEILFPQYISIWKNLNRENGNPLDEMIAVFQFFKSNTKKENVILGCPVNNLVQEMSPLDEEFRKRLSRIFAEEQKAIKAGLELGIKQNQIKDIDPDKMSFFILASFEGAYSMAKSFQSKEVFDQCIDQLIQTLDGIRK